jgi:hypothetical protein
MEEGKEVTGMGRGGRAETGSHLQARAEDHHVILFVLQSA